MKVAENRSYLNGTLPANLIEADVEHLEDPFRTGSFTVQATILDDEAEVSLEIVNTTVLEKNMSDSSEHYEDANPHEWEGGGMEDLSAKELLKLPLEKRRRILEKKTEDIEEEYEEGGDLRIFQALEEDDFYANP